jgi:hypothetical protein
MVDALRENLEDEDEDNAEHAAGSRFQLLASARHA